MHYAYVFLVRKRNRSDRIWYSSSSHLSDSLRSRPFIAATGPLPFKRLGWFGVAFTRQEDWFRSPLTKAHPEQTWRTNVLARSSQGHSFSSCPTSTSITLLKKYWKVLCQHIYVTLSICIHLKHFFN